MSGGFHWIIILTNVDDKYMTGSISSTCGITSGFGDSALMVH